MKYQSQERTQNRKLEREALQFKSKQMLSNPEATGIFNVSYLIEMMASQEPMLFEELSLRRSNNYKDPSRPMTASTAFNWNKYPTKQLDKVITPKILEMDKKGCESIRQKIEYEKAIENMLNGISNTYANDGMAMSWVEENRLKIRAKFLKRHEENIEKERRAGVFKDYQTISERAKRGNSSNGTRNRPFTTNDQRERVHRKNNLEGKINTQLLIPAAHLFCALVLESKSILTRYRLFNQ